MKRLFSFTALFVVLTMMASGCALQKAHNLPPAERLMEPGPGVAGPGPGVLPPMMPPGGIIPGAAPTIQLLFDQANQMEGMQVRWDVGTGNFASEPQVVPFKSNFPHNGVFRLKLTNIPERVGVELYPTVELWPVTPRTGAYLAHNAIPIQFTNEDFDQVESNNYVTKVIYLPDPEFQELAQAGIETLVSTRLDPGVDPIVEADERGAIMAIVRLGNKDIEMPGTVDGAGGVMAASHSAGAAYAGVPCGPGGGPPALPNYVAGITAPTWGMPYSGTPIGLPGPPHIPMGGPAGLRSHSMRNNTPMFIPDPPRQMKINVRQNPGYSYPRPASRVNIFEQNIHAPQRYRQPLHDRHRRVH